MTEEFIAKDIAQHPPRPEETFPLMEKILGAIQKEQI